MDVPHHRRSGDPPRQAGVQKGGVLTGVHEGDVVVTDPANMSTNYVQEIAERPQPRARDDVRHCARCPYPLGPRAVEEAHEDRHETSAIDTDDDVVYDDRR